MLSQLLVPRPQSRRTNHRLRSIYCSISTPLAIFSQELVPADHVTSKMAASSAAEEAAVYLIVSGIPSELRSAQLRSYFSQFREQCGCGFLCFHYRHRPERAHPQAAPDSTLTPIRQGLAQTSLNDARTVSTQDSAPAQTRTCCCVISVRGPTQAQRFLRMYSGRRWLDSQGTWLPGRCFIRRLRLPTEASGTRRRDNRLGLLEALERRHRP